MYKHRLLLLLRSGNHIPASSSQHLLEDLALGPLELLAVDKGVGVLSPLVLNILLVLGLGGVELGEAVRLPVRSDVEGGGSLLTADKEGTADKAVGVVTVDGTGAEDELAGGLETSKETAYAS